MRLIAALAAFSLIATAGQAGTIACRNAKGQAAKCGTPGAIPAAAKTTTSNKCRDAKGHYAKCGTPGAKPA